MFREGPAEGSVAMALVFKPELYAMVCTVHWVERACMVVIAGVGGSVAWGAWSPHAAGGGGHGHCSLELVRRWPPGSRLVVLGDWNVDASLGPRLFNTSQHLARAFLRWARPASGWALRPTFDPTWLELAKSGSTLAQIDQKLARIGQVWRTLANIGKF